MRPTKIRKRVDNVSQEINLEEIFSGLKAKMEFLELLSTIFVDSDDPLLRQQILIGRQDVRKDIIKLVRNGISLPDMFAKFGAILYRSQALQAKDLLQSSSGQMKELADLVNEDHLLEERTHARLTQMNDPFLKALERINRRNKYGGINIEYDKEIYRPPAQPPVMPPPPSAFSMPSSYESDSSSSGGQSNRVPSPRGSVHTNYQSARNSAPLQSNRGQRGPPGVFGLSNQNIPYPQIQPNAPPQIQPNIGPPQIRPSAPPQIRPNAPPLIRPNIGPHIQSSVAPQIRPSAPPISPLQNQNHNSAPVNNEAGARNPNDRALSIPPQSRGRALPENTSSQIRVASQRNRSSLSQQRIGQDLSIRIGGLEFPNEARRGNDVSQDLRDRSDRIFNQYLARFNVGSQSFFPGTPRSSYRFTQRPTGGEMLRMILEAELRNPNLQHPGQNLETLKQQIKDLESNPLRQQEEEKKDLNIDQSLMSIVQATPSPQLDPQIAIKREQIKQQLRSVEQSLQNQTAFDSNTMPLYRNAAHLIGQLDEGWMVWELIWGIERELELFNTIDGHPIPIDLKNKASADVMAEKLQYNAAAKDHTLQKNIASIIDIFEKQLDILRKGSVPSQDLDQSMTSNQSTIRRVKVKVKAPKKSTTEPRQVEPMVIQQADTSLQQQQQPVATTFFYNVPPAKSPERAKSKTKEEEKKTSRSITPTRGRTRQRDLPQPQAPEERKRSASFQRVDQFKTNRSAIEEAKYQISQNNLAEAASILSEGTQRYADKDTQGKNKGFYIDIESKGFEKAMMSLQQGLKSDQDPQVHNYLRSLGNLRGTKKDKSRQLSQILGDLSRHLQSRMSI